MFGAEDARRHVPEAVRKEAAASRLRDRLPWPAAAALILGASALCWSALAMLVVRFMG